ncbi:MAG: tetratricopeptide repeat protein [Chloroflexi bacterium]|nr:tetratricopeptide repeat protein [Chloroflexota bacterium]
MNAIHTVRNASDADLTRWTKRVALLVVLAFLAFAAFYAADRWRPPAPAIVDQQIAGLEQAVRDNPNDIAVRGQLADAYAAKGRYVEAIAQYDVIIAAGVSLEPAHLGRGRALQELGRLDEAAQAFEAVVAVAKDGEMAHVDLGLQAAYYGLGSIAMQQDRPQDAIGHFEKALAISRSDADSLYLLGTAFIATGAPSKAITVLRASVTFVPVGWSEPYVALAEAYEATGEAALGAWATAMAQLMSGDSAAAEPALLALVEGDAALDAAIGLGLLYETGGDNARAAEWYGRALEIDPASSAAGLGLGRVGPTPTDAEGSGS